MSLAPLGSFLIGKTLPHLPPPASGRGLLPWLRQHPVPSILVLAGTILAGWVLWMYVRRAVLRTQDRVRFQLLPSPGFVVSPEDVRRFAGVLGAGPSLPKRLLGIGEPVVFRLRRVPPSDIAFVIEVPARLAGRVRAACYAGVEAIEIPAHRLRASDDSDGAELVRELTLRKEALSPLREVRLAPDPKALLCAVLGGLHSGESAEVVLSLWPAVRAWHRHLSRARNEGRASHFMASVVAEMNKRRPPPRQVRHVPDKAAGGVPVFRARLHLAARAESRRRARALLADLASGFEVFTGENSLRSLGRLRTGLGPGRPLTPRSLPRRLAWGDLPPRRGQFLTVPEVAPLCFPPAADCRGPIARTGIAPVPRRDLPRYTPAGAGVLPLGTARIRGDEVEVGFRAKDLLGPVYVCGKARSGKTWLLEAMAVHLARARAGFCFVDPHHDAYAELTEYLSGRPDVMLVDLSRQDRQAGLNPLQVGRPRDVADVVSRTVGAFQAAYGWTDRSHPRTLTIARMATQALVEANLKLPEGRRATIFQISTLLTDPEWRGFVLPHLSQEVRRYFDHEFPRYEPGAVAPLLDKVSALRADRRTKLLLGQPESTLDVADAMDSGKALLVSLAGLGDKGQLVGSLIVYEFFRAAKARAATAPGDRRPFYMLCDEVQLYQGPVLAAACGEAPKYGLKLVLANQFPGHLSKEVRGAILANYSQLFCFTTDHPDAQLLAHELGPPVAAEHLVSLSRFDCFCRLTVQRERLGAFQARTLDLAERFRDLHHPELAPRLQTDSDRAIASGEGDRVLRLTDRLDDLIGEWFGKDKAKAHATRTHGS